MSRQNYKWYWARYQAGQIVVEYVLLLIIGVSIAVLISSLLISRSPENPGLLITKWNQIINAIGIDPADDLKSGDEAE